MGHRRQRFNILVSKENIPGIAVNQLVPSTKSDLSPPRRICSRPTSEEASCRAKIVVVCKAEERFLGSCEPRITKFSFLKQIMIGMANFKCIVVVNP
mmetsp:Transcript_5061/g.10266  ORF Transcript_5061/g.10266 Transcript_5061/m.10266 type:complete len:97 (-) Transcript_5061:2492-2782(-)